eukprot:3357524-Prymnesium_polylepis.1
MSPGGRTWPSDQLTDPDPEFFSSDHVFTAEMVWKPRHFFFRSRMHALIPISRSRQVLPPGDEHASCSLPHSACSATEAMNV